MKLFEYIKKSLETLSSVSLDTWGDEERSKFYHEMSKIYDPENPVVNYDGDIYI